MIFNVAVWTASQYVTKIIIEQLQNDQKNNIPLLLVLETATTIGMIIALLLVNLMSRKLKLKIEPRIKKWYLESNKNINYYNFKNSDFQNDFFWNSNTLNTNYFMAKVEIIGESFSILIAFLGLIFISFIAAWIALGTNLMIVITSWLIGKRESEVKKLFSNKRKSFIKNSKNFLEGYNEIFAFNKNQTFLSKINDKNQEYYKNQKRVYWKETFVSWIQNLGIGFFA